MSSNDESEGNDDASSSIDEFDEFITLGKSSQFRTIKWKFPDTKKCPLNECSLSFSGREIALVHFRLNHAATAMVCTICNIPFSSACTSNLEQHYEIFHPWAHLPKIKKSHAADDNSWTVLERMTAAGTYDFDDFDGMKSDDDDEGSDWIELTGCNKNSVWKFPLVTKCPVLTCFAEFNTRKATIAHYKDSHAKHSILCYLCNFPILGTDFVMHFRLIHPNEVIPFNFDNNASESSKTEDSPPHTQNDTLSESNDDWIELGGCKRKTYWRFPKNMIRCPVQKCRQRDFPNRAACMKHYTLAHAKSSVLCELCERPIVSLLSAGLYSHYQRIHPGEKVPDYEYRRPGGSYRRPNQRTRSCTQVNDNSSDLTANSGCTVNKDDDEGDDDSENDKMKLSGCGILTYWSMPANLNRCPVNCCWKVFENNYALRQHYKTEHAKNSILCEPCGWPLVAKSRKPFIDHFRSIHPNIAVPYGLEPRNIRNAYEKEGSREDHPNHERFDCTSDNITSTSTATSVTSEKSQPTNNDDGVNDLIKLGRKCNQINYWRFPARTTRCPSNDCALDFESRSAAIRHFRKQHADSYILCSFCAKPVYAPSIIKLKAHFKRVHPLYALDENDKTTDANNGTQKNGKMADQNMDPNDERDWIVELHGCGIVTKWTFPQTTCCPSRACSLSFASRSNARDHYIKAHSQDVILCPQPLCNKPIDVKYISNFLRHHRRVHGNLELPYEFMKQSSSQVAQVAQQKLSGISPSINGDWIELNSCGISSRFQFPRNRTRCLNIRCNMSFKTRPKAIQHYKMAHSKAAIYCEPCKKPIHTTYLPYWQAHCDSKHPEMKSKANVESNPIVGISTVPKLSSSKHLSKSETKIVCPLKGCSYKSRRMHKIRKHWNKVHGDLRFPIVHEKNDSSVDNRIDKTKEGTGEEDRISKNDMDNDLLVPLPESPHSFEDQESPCAKRQKTSDDVADVYTFTDNEDEFRDGENPKLAKENTENVLCDGNVTSTAECSIELGNIKVEMDSDEEPPEMPQFSTNSGFVLGEAHSLPPEDFRIEIESDDDSFHSIEMSPETIELSCTTTFVDEKDGKKLAKSNDEMEVTTTSQECSLDNQ